MSKITSKITICNTSRKKAVSGKVDGTEKVINPLTSIEVSKEDGTALIKKHSEIVNGSDTIRIFNNARKSLHIIVKKVSYKLDPKKTVEVQASYAITLMKMYPTIVDSEEVIPSSAIKDKIKIVEARLAEANGIIATKLEIISSLQAENEKLTAENEKLKSKNETKNTAVAPAANADK